MGSRAMNRRERNKQKKKKARQERLRQEKHLRQSQPREKDEAEPEDVDLDDPPQRALELASQARGHPDPTESARLAHAALRLDPDCMDAFITLAAVETQTPDEVISRLKEAVAAGERTLGA